MTATKRKPASRKPAQSKKIKLTEAEERHLASLPPRVRKLHLMAKPLTGKLTKALLIK